MSTNAQAEIKIPPLITTNNKLLHVDGLVIYGRSDGTNTLRFTAMVPEGRLEQCQMIINNEAMKRIVSAMCKHTGYYPEQPAKS